MAMVMMVLCNRRRAKTREWINNIEKEKKWYIKWP